MSSSSLPVVLVTSASGSVGIFALLALAATKKFRLRAGVRNPEKPFNTDSYAYKQLLQLSYDDQKHFLSVVEFFPLSQESDPQAIEKAFQGVSYVYLIVPLMENAYSLCEFYLNACLQYNIRFLIKLSTIGVSLNSPLFSSRAHARQDEMIEKSRIPACIIQSAPFMDNYLKYDLPSIKNRGIFFGSSGENSSSTAAGGAGKSASVDCRDLAALVAGIFQNIPEYSGVSLAITGGKSYSDTEAADLITKITGKSVKYCSLPENIYRQNLIDWGVPEWQIHDLIGLDRLKNSGKLSNRTETLQQILGRPPITLEEHIEYYSREFHQEEFVEFDTNQFDKN